MAEKHFFEQQKHTENYLIPYFDRHVPGWREFRILEAGCAEAGLIDVLSHLGISVSGIELERHRVDFVRKINPGLDVQAGDITDPELKRRFPEPFDLIILRDVIEHIPDRHAVFRNMRQLLKKGGFLFISFPPRFSPFGGHHQNGRSLLKHLPFLHLLPAGNIRWLGKLFHEQENVVESAILNERIGLTVHRFEKLMREYQFCPAVFECFISRPVYRTRFGWRIVHFPNIPFLREFMTLGCECLLKKQ